MERQGTIPLSKHGQREVSVFTADELLYDHFCGKLDAERDEAVRRAIQKSGKLKEELASLSRAVQYAQSLGEMNLPPGMLEKIDEPDTYLSVLLKKTNFERWPLTVRWGIEASIVLCAFMVVVVVFPWQKWLQDGLTSQGRDVILAELDHATKAGSGEGLVEEGDEANRFEDEGVKPPETPLAVLTPGPLEPLVIPNQKSDEATASASPVTAPKPPTEKNPHQEVTAAVTDKKVAEGALYRGILRVTNLPATGPKIIEKIQELGGRKAGQVELGWNKTPSSSYFHFTMPQAKYDELVAFLATYGNAQIRKEKHPRIMPEGIVRLIIEVEEAKE